MSSNRLRLLLVGMMAVFAISAVASASASAEFKKLWDICEKGGGSGTKFDNHKCNSHELPEQKWEWVVKESNTYKEKVVSSGGIFTLTAGGKVVTCKKVTDKGTITGGKPGTDLAESITFTECTTKQAGCSVKTVGQANGTIVVTNIPTKLEERAGKLVDNFEQNATTKEFVTLKFEGTCSEYPETKVKGTVAAEVVAGTGELNFPTTSIEKDTLEAFGIKATLTGKDTQELENGWVYTAI